MKGFNYLSPDRFYDAICAYGLPNDIIKLDTAAQANIQCFIHTEYGATAPITVNGISKQGGPASQLSQPAWDTITYKIVLKRTNMCS